MATFYICGPCLVPNNDIGLDVGVKEANLLALTLLSAIDADTISGFCSTTTQAKRFYEGKSELIMNVEQLARYLEEERGVTASRAENLAALWGGAVVETVVQMSAISPCDGLSWDGDIKPYLERNHTHFEAP